VVGSAGGRGGGGRGRVAPNSSAGTTPPNGTSSTPLGEGEAFDWKSANNVTFDQPKLGFTVQGFTVPGVACGEVRVTAVERGSLAEQRGVCLGDVLLACNGTPFAGIPAREAIERVRSTSLPKTISFGPQDVLPAAVAPTAASPSAAAAVSTCPLIALEDDTPLSSVPDVFIRRLSESDQFVLLACDGVWDVYGDGAACNLVAKGLAMHGNDPQRAAQHLVDSVLRSGRCTDNVTAVVVLLTWP